jgi:tetratricopeptide (TPR) repeat protein
MTDRQCARLLAPCLLILAAAPGAPAAPPSPLQEARERWLRGNYDEAQAAYEKLAADPKLKGPAAVGLSRALESKGEYDQALAAVEGALAGLPKDAGLLARRAELLYLRGRWDEAVKAADEAVAADKNNFPARWVRAQVFRDRGDLKKADEECVWFVRAYNDQDVQDPERLLLVGLASAEHARRHNLADQFADILNDVFGEAAKKDKAFWPAHHQSALLLLEKYNRGEALDEIGKALAVNPNAAEVQAAKGAALLERFEIKAADDLAERALKVNPSLPEALRLRADVHLASGEPAAALRELGLARKVNPRDERTLARVAACLHIQRKATDLDALTKEVERFDPKPASYFYELGERLEERRRYGEAEKYYRKAAELRPAMPGPSNSLGMLYMRLGREKEAAELLDKGFKADPFNVRVSNTRKVLQHLQKYETLTTDHFELRYDPKNDAALARYMGEYLERIYAELGDKFRHRPEGKKILVEVFNNHDMFSGRVVALPDLHTIGACTGRMLAMVSPHGKGVRRPFNWARVLRHEVVHIFNLDQAHFLVPHWLTEGLAVSNEGFPRPPSWNQLLRERVPAGELMNLDSIDLGFIRPRDQSQWNMAYCQSQLYVEYLKATYGPEVVGGLLAAYGEGLDTASALRKVCKAEKAEVEKGYRAFLDKTVAGLSARPPEKRRSLRELKAAHEKDPGDAEAAAALAEALFGTSRPEARKLAEEALERKKGQPTASLVLARLEEQAGNVKRQRELLEAAVDRDAPDPRVLLALGKLYYDAGDLAHAAETWELGRKAEPWEPAWLERLARAYAQTNDKDKLVAVLKDYVPTDADDLEHRKRLTRLLLEAEDFAGAEKYAREAMEIDLNDADVRGYLDKALRGQKKDAEADHLRELLDGKK